MDQLGKVANPARGQLNRDFCFSLYPRLRLRIWSRESGSAIPSRVSQLILRNQAESDAYPRTPLLPPAFRDIDYDDEDVHMYRQPPSTAIGSVPSLSDRAIAYRWRSLPRIRQHRASSPQGSSSNGCFLFRFQQAPILMRLSFPTPTSLLVCSGRV